jgi:hypothetical protein
LHNFLFYFLLFFILTVFIFFSYFEQEALEEASACFPLIWHGLPIEQKINLEGIHRELNE